MAEYTPSDDDVRARASMAPPGHAIESVRGRQRAEFDRWLRAHDARVRRDAAREALDALQKAELAIIPPDAEETHPTRTQQQALAWRIEMYMLALLPEGDPVNDKTTAADLLEETP